MNTSARSLEIVAEWLVCRAKSPVGSSSGVIRRSALLALSFAGIDRAAFVGVVRVTDFPGTLSNEGHTPRRFLRFASTQPAQGFSNDLSFAFFRHPGPSWSPAPLHEEAPKARCLIHFGSLRP